MLLPVTSLSDSEIELVTSAVREWCRSHHCGIDSIEGRSALSIAIDLVQSKCDEASLVWELMHRLTG
jgi:hypothetical protein